MSKRKITFVVGNRAHYARVKPVIKYLPSESYNLVLFESAAVAEYGNVKEQIVTDVGGDNISTIYTNVSGGNLVTMTKSTGLAVSELATEFQRNRPDIIVVIADRYESLAATIAARYMNIPVAHIQGGENTGSIDDNIRHAITKLSNIHLVTNSECAERVAKMGENKDAIFKVGCPTLDICREVGDVDPKGLFADYEGVQEKKFVLGDDYIIVSFHPVTTEYLENRKHFRTLLEAVDTLNVQAVWLYPNIDAGNDLIRQELLDFKSHDKKGLIHFFKHFEIENYLLLLNHAKCIVGNSSVGIRESSYLGTPSVTIGSRQHGRTRAINVIDSEISVESITNNVQKQMSHGKYARSNEYGDGNSGERIADILLSCSLSIDKHMTY
ncbi:MAG: UDP-N-acetylglucosamine 2-epimerase (hydrolyzing) [Bdellovibrionales bacterium]|nr:UDP-N-acetylglucosamine 2-epimerase (hydrolyzing) [Bdellovibrionales bacterium]